MPFASSDFNWDDGAIARLRALWGEGHSTAEIGHRLGTSKNAVIGKVHRLQLEPRTSPIRRGSATTPRRLPRPPIPKLPVLPSLAARPVTKPAPSNEPPPPRPRPDPPPLGETPCCWPIGDPGTPDFRFCGEDNLLGKPYCPGHCAIAFVRPRSRRDAA